MALDQLNSQAWFTNTTTADNDELVFSKKLLDREESAVSNEQLDEISLGSQPSPDTGGGWEREGEKIGSDTTGAGAKKSFEPDQATGVKLTLEAIFFFFAMKMKGDGKVGEVDKGGGEVEGRLSEKGRSDRRGRSNYARNKKKK